MRTSTPLYNPDTAKQYQAGLRLDSAALAQAVAGPYALGWAPQISHITTSAATTNRRKTNPLLAATPESARKKNPFILPEVPSANLFGINIPR